MFDFRQRVFTITALLLLIAGLVALTQPSSLKSMLTTQPSLSPSSPANSPSSIPHASSSPPAARVTGAHVTGYSVAGPSIDAAFEWAHISQFALYVFILGIISVGVFQLAAVSARLGDKEDARQGVVAYIKQAREQGFSHGQIKQRLQAEGWDDNDLEKSLNRVM